MTLRRSATYASLPQCRLPSRDASTGPICLDCWSPASWRNGHVQGHGNAFAGDRRRVLRARMEKALDALCRSRANSCAWLNKSLPIPTALLCSRKARGKISGSSGPLHVRASNPKESTLAGPSELHAPQKLPGKSKGQSDEGRSFLQPDKALFRQRWEEASSTRHRRASVRCSFPIRSTAATGP